MSAESANVVALDWRNGLRKVKDRFAGDELNLLSAFRACPDLRGLVRWNEFQNRMEFARSAPWRRTAVGDQWLDGDDLDAQAFLLRLEIDVRVRSIVADVAERVARDTPYHPVRAYLDKLRWDGTPRLHLWLAAFLDAVDSPEYLEAVGRKFLISAVARVMRPGCKADHVLVLEGRQGIGKSTAVTALGGPWTTDSIPEFHGADAALQLAGVWLVELPELAALRRSEIETVKAFITRQEDHYRPPYGRRPVRIPRQSVFVATTNEAQYLHDPSGNRRFWPVRCNAVDLPGLRAARDQLWAEARAAFDAGEAWHLTEAETELATAEQSERVLVTELEQQVAEYLDRMRATGTHELTMRDVLAKACFLDPEAPDYVEKAGRLGTKVAAALERAGWHRIGAQGRGANRRVIYRCSQGSQGFTG